MATELELEGVLLASLELEMGVELELPSSVVATQALSSVALKASRSGRCIMNPQIGVIDIIAHFKLKTYCFLVLQSINDTFV